MRALFLAFPDDEGAYEHADDQFMVGEALLVAPIVEQNKSSRSVKSLDLSDPLRALVCAPLEMAAEFLVAAVSKTFWKLCFSQ